MSLNILTKYIGKFVFFALLQVLVLQNIQLTDFGISPQIYVVLILLLPFETPGWMLIIFGFTMGLSIDIFYDTGGSHAVALVFIAFIRPTVLQFIAPRGGYESGTVPRIFHFGVSWFARYTVIFVFIHHFIYFLVEAFSFSDFHITMLKVFLTTIFSTLLIVLSQFLIFRK